MDELQSTYQGQPHLVWGAALERLSEKELHGVHLLEGRAELKRLKLHLVRTA